MKGASLQRCVKDEGGVTAIEFALVMPAFMAFILGIINLSLLCLTVASLHYSVGEGARCAAVKTACPAPEGRYFAPGPAPVFTLAMAPCGHALSATVTFNINVILFQKDIPLAATACFP
jgi:Flp pilus assembly pilin Flp